MNNSTMEMGLIGSILNDNTLINKISVTKEMFTNKSLGCVWEVITNSISSGKLIDAIILLDHFSSNNQHDLHSVLGQCLLSGYNPPAMAEGYGNRITQNFIKNKVIGIADELKANPEKFNEAISQLMSIGQSAKNFDVGINDVIAEALKHVEEVSQSTGLTGVTTGIEKLDNVLGGFQSSDLIIVAARPSMGKTALMLNMLLSAKCPAGVFSAEMGRLQIGERILSISSGVEAQRIRMGKVDSLDYSEMVLGTQEVIKSNIRINDQPAPTIDEIVNQARKWKLEHGIKVIYFDYLQRIKFTGNGPRHELVGSGARMFKELARELDIPIIVLAQVNRNAEGRRPGLADLAQSGEIEAEADVIAFLYRDEVYHKDSEFKGIAEIDIAKNRQGATGSIRCVWKAKSMQFKDISDATYGID